MKSVSTRPVLHGQGLTKDFGNGKGVFDVTISVHRGELVGFVGPNGAGKSTTINVLTGLSRPQHGRIRIFGRSYAGTTMFRVMHRIGVLYSEQTLDVHLTPEQVFRQSQQLLGRDCSTQWRAMAALLELDVRTHIKKLSLGNKKKVGIVHALMHEPDLIIMDEPTSGLDPLIRDKFQALLKQAVKRGAAVLLSSHDLNEVQEIADTIVMIKSGRIIMNDATSIVLNKAQRVFRLVNPPQAVVEAIRSLPLLVHIERNGADVVFRTNDYESAMNLLTERRFYNVYIEHPSLEEAFMEYYE